MKPLEELKESLDQLCFDGLGPRPNYDLVHDVKCTSSIRDNMLVVSGEDGKGLVDYYGEFRGGLPYINPKLEAWAKEQGCYWEWEDASCIVLAE